MKKKVIDLEIIEDLEQSGVSQIALVDVPAIEKYWMAFKKEEFVEPQAGESQEEFLGRCIPAMLDEGKEQDQAVAMCYSMYENMSYDTGALPVYTDEIPKKKEKFVDTFLDYPEKAVLNARRALDWAEKNGWGDCGTPIGKMRANQLAKRQSISEDTIARMAAFERHRQNSKTPYGEGCGKLMWDAWGGTEGIEWAQRKLRQIRGEEFAATEMNVYGYPTRFFYMCPGALATFQHLVEMNLTDDDVVGMIRSAAVLADRVFEIEKDVIDAEQASKSQLMEAILLVDDFKDIFEEIDEDTGMVHDISYMDGHIIKINEYYTEEFASVEELKVGDEVSWKTADKNPRGRIREIITEGEKKVPGADFAISGTPENPGYLIEIYEEVDGGWEPTGRLVGRKADSILKNVALSAIPQSRLLFASEDQQILVGPVAVPDMEIVRKDKDTKEIYYVRFSKEVVQKMAEKFMRELRNDQTNIQHNPEDEAGSYIMETWIVENEEDKANSVYDLGVPVGSWVVKMRVTDPQTWKMVKEGKLRGFSLEGSFLDKADWDQYQKDREVYNKIIKILKSS
jgi:hypothetical protein